MAHPRRSSLSPLCQSPQGTFPCNSPRANDWRPGLWSLEVNGPWSLPWKLRVAQLSALHKASGPGVGKRFRV